jgi:Xaa-Pro aminopeptidase
MKMETPAASKAAIQAQKLAALRAAMKTHGLSAVVIPSNDPHQSEYVARHWKAREWISGFTGSAGTAVVTLDRAGLWTDSRYFLQAEQELAGTDVTFFKQAVAGAPEHREWLKSQLKSGDRVAIDGKVLSMDQLGSWEAAFAGTGIDLVTHADPVGEAWWDRPALPEDPVFEHALPLAGLSRAQKLAMVREQMERRGASRHLVVTLDDIAWIFNLRGRDVEYNPVFYAYALIGKEKAWLFIQPSKVPPVVAEALAADGVEIVDYAALPGHLAQLDDSLLLDPSIVSVALFSEIMDYCTVVQGATPSVAMKACKGQVETGHIRRAMEKDGVALLRLCRWLEAEVEKGTVTEHAVGEQLAAFRARQEGYFGESFPAIAGYAGNAAIVHYRPEAAGSATLRPEGVFLLDSGGQYEDGTTDITRTFALGSVPPAAVQAYTLVLKGHIAIATARFPRGTVGYQLDPLARNHLWSAGLNFGHGTGHGVGYFLCVHEGPQGISPLANPRSSTPLEPGMIISNEPGYYETGIFGIRIENLVLVVEDPVGSVETGSSKFLAFETLSLFPIEATMVDRTLLTPGEKEWLKSYHGEVLRRLSPRLLGDEVEWLSTKCGAWF